MAYSGIGADSSRIWGCEGNSYNPLLHNSRISFDSLRSANKADFNFGTPAASTSSHFTHDFALNSHLEPRRGGSVSQDSTTETDGSERRVKIRSTLPVWAMTVEGQVLLSLTDIVRRNLLERFARDRLGCQFLQSAYPTAAPEVRALIVREILENTGVFQSLSCDVFGNFFVQKFVEHASPQELEMVAARLKPQMFHYCYNRYSCRVVQKVFDYLPEDLKLILVRQLHHANIVRLAIDQNGNHVIQKIMNSFPLSAWGFVLEAFLIKDENLFSAAEDKYGCRIIQLAVERLVAMEKDPLRELYLERTMKLIVKSCHRLTVNEYSNYIIQFIIGAESLAVYRDQIIEECLLKNILNMAQEKCASHVIEKAMEHAPFHLLKEMMEEIFDGYVPHPESRRDALDIIMFHQYGNYIIQRMMKICVDAARAKSNGCNSPDMAHRLNWLRRLCGRIIENEAKLHRYSSGKKIMVMLEQIPPALRPSLPLLYRPPRSFFNFQDPLNPSFDYLFAAHFPF